MPPSPSTSPETPPNMQNRDSTSTPTTSSMAPPPQPSTSTAVAQAFRLPICPRFLHLWTHAQSLIAHHGTYTLLPGTRIFTRARRAPSKPEPPSIEALANSLAAAQAAMHTTQPAGPAKDDLQLFKLLSDASTDVIEKILSDSESTTPTPTSTPTTTSDTPTPILDPEVRAWGLIGMTAAHLDSPASSAADKEKFSGYRARLRAALETLPSLTPHAARGENVSPDQRVFALVKGRREVHVCSKLMVAQLRKEGWTTVRWYHAVAVAERWVRNLGLA